MNPRDPNRTMESAELAAADVQSTPGTAPHAECSREYPHIIRNLAARYIWWQPPEESLAFPLRVVAQILDLGTAADCVVLEEYFGEESLREALRHAEPGWFRERSWNYWHYRLGLTPWGEDPPPLPKRTYVA